MVDLEVADFLRLSIRNISVFLRRERIAPWESLDARSVDIEILNGSKIVGLVALNRATDRSASPEQAVGRSNGGKRVPGV